MNWLQKEKKHKREMAAVQIEIVIHIFCWVHSFRFVCSFHRIIFFLLL